MFSPSPLKREFEDDSDIMSLDQCQFSPYSAYMEEMNNNAYKRARHHNWTLDHLCTLPYSPLATVDLQDDSFESYWGELMDKEKAHNVAGDSKNITLKDMCRKGLIREEDVIVYKRNFSASKTVVCKSMTVVKASGLSGISIQLDGEIFQDFETPTALETKILDHHGKVAKDKRPNGNAFKSIRLIRAGKDLGRLFDIRKDSFEEL
ncbi:hypothetical protein G6F38_010296 [Rhizopus arrhizus]|nr:hypothetical protein G6F38_010296 [Rhizopus arrhizus]